MLCFFSDPVDVGTHDPIERIACQSRETLPGKMEICMSLMATRQGMPKMLRPEKFKVAGSSRINFGASLSAMALQRVKNRGHLLVRDGA